MTDHDHDNPNDAVDIDARLRAAVDRARADAPDTDGAQIIEQARSARDHAAGHRRRRVRGVTLGAAAALLLIVFGVALALQRDTTPTDVAGPPTTDPGALIEPGDPGSGSAAGSAGDPGAGTMPGTDTTPPPTIDRPGGNNSSPGCPTEPEYYAQSPAPSASPAGDLLTFTPTEATLCTYAADGIRSMRFITDPGKLASIRTDLNELPAADPDLPCTSEMGPHYGLVATDGSRTTIVWLQHYGCGNVFTGDQLRSGAKSLDWLSG